MNQEKHVRQLYQNLINDIDFERLELELKDPNIFQILSISRTEIRHSNFLAWLLEPEGTHGLGKIFLRKFLREIATSEISVDLDELDIEGLDLTKTEIRREWKHIDLLILMDDLVICIENKVDTHDHSNQLEKYRSIVDEHFPKHKKVFVYLSPKGSLPKSVLEHEYYAPYSYENIIEHLDQILSIHGNSMNPKVHQYISDYLVTLKRELMKNDNLNEIANKIYKSHKDLIDFVYENKTDISSEFYPIFAKKIEESGWILGSKNKGYARFLTPKLQNIIPRKGKGWPDKECFSFEIDYFWTPNKCIFKTIIAPASEEIQQVLCEALESVPNHKTPKGKKWLVHFQHTWKFDNDQLLVLEPEEIQKLIDKEWDKVTEIVEKVETALLERADKLKALV